MRQIFEKYGATHLGRQELAGELLDELPGALFTRASIEAGRVQAAPELSRIVVAIDPAVTSGEASNESGIVVVGMSADLDFYVLEDASMIATPDTVIRQALELLRRHNADSLVVEKNQGGDLWSTIVNQLDPTVAVHLVHASRGKATRAEPVAARYEQGRVKHVGIFPALEDQLTCFVPGVDEGADDRLDALVWGVTELDTRSQPEITMDISINHAGKGLPWL
jgi:predicted phage terminase large subunit-like protein